MTKLSLSQHLISIFKKFSKNFSKSEIPQSTTQGKYGDPLTVNRAFVFTTMVNVVLIVPSLPLESSKIQSMEKSKLFISMFFLSVYPEI